VSTIGVMTLLAAGDRFSVIAVIVLAVFSMIGNWLKKRAEERAGAGGIRTQDDDEFEPVELFEERKPIRTPPPRPIRPKPPPVLVTPPTGYHHPTARKTPPRPGNEWATRVSGTKVPTPIVPHSESAGQRKEPKRVTAPLAETGAAFSPDDRTPDLHDLVTLRRAIIAAEILGPPIALRDPAAAISRIT
jgi:hypothetical protein